MRKFVLDTNLYIRAFRERDAAEELARFYTAFTPGCLLSSVVLHELLVGARTPEKGRQIQEEIARPFRRTGRIFTPSQRAWEEAAEVLGRLAVAEGLELRTVSRSFVNDILLAVSCREAGAVLVTGNERDFSRIRREARFEFTAPWPG